MARKKADIEGQLSFVAVSNEGGTGKTLKLPEVYKYEIKKSNILVFDSVLNYSLIEYKLLNYITMLIKPPVKGTDGELIFKYNYEFDLKDFYEKAGMHKDGKSQQRAIAALGGLRAKTVVIVNDDDNISIVGVLDSIDIIKGRAYIKINEKMTPYILDKQSRFLTYGSQNTMLMDSKYALRLYEWIKSLHNIEIYKRMKNVRRKEELTKMTAEEKAEYTNKVNAIYNASYKFRINLTKLKSSMNVPASNRGYKMFDNNILSVAVAEFNQKTDLFISKYSYDTKTDDVIFAVKRKDIFERNVTDDYLEKLLNHEELAKSV